MKLVDNYISALELNEKEWISIMVNFMRENFPDLEETFYNKKPTYKGENYFIAFASQKNYFSFYTDDKRGFSLIKELVPSASFGKGYISIKYSYELFFCHLLNLSLIFHLLQ